MANKARRVIDPLAAFCLAFLFTLPALAGTIVGSVQTATGGSVVNGTLTFTLSQPGVLSGTATLVTSAVSCYTSTAGSVVGIPDPLALPVLSTNTASGTLAAGTYFVKITYTGAGGESVASPEQSVVLSAQGTVIVTAPAVQPASATGYKVYISTTTGTETLQGTVVGFGNYSQNAPLVSGAALPVSNSSTCSLVFSDQIIPTGTFYTVSLFNKNGSQIAGFPQTWCTFGGAAGTINVSNGAPTGNCGTNGVFYPAPIYAVPQNGAAQSISGPLSVTSTFSATGGGAFGGAFTGNPSFSGIVTECTVNGISYVGSRAPYTTCWGTSDIGAQINAAYAACPSSGCHIIVTPGAYSYTTPIVFGNSNKGALLDCSRGQVLQQVPTGVTTLTFTPSSGAAITFNDGPGGMDGCILIGTGHAGTTGLALTYIRTSTFQNDDISNFDIGINCGGCNLAAQFFVNTFINLQVHDNLTNNLLAPTGGPGAENVVFFGGAFFTKTVAYSTTCIDIGSGVEFSFYGTSFDQCGMTLRGTGTTVNLFHGHFENPNGSTASDFITLAANCVQCILNLHGGKFLEDSASARTEFISNLATNGGGGVNYIFVNGTQFIPAENVTQCLRAASNVFVQIIATSHLINSNGNGFTCTTLYNANFASQYLGGQMQAKRGTAGCTTGAAAGNNCASAITVTWPFGFGDTNYSVNCTGQGTPTNAPSGPYVASKSNGSITVNYFAITAAAASYPTIDCIAVHD